MSYLWYFNSISRHKLLFPAKLQIVMVVAIVVATAVIVVVVIVVVVGLLKGFFASLQKSILTFKVWKIDSGFLWQHFWLTSRTLFLLRAEENFNFKGQLFSQTKKYKIYSIKQKNFIYRTNLSDVLCKINGAVVVIKPYECWVISPISQ